MADPVGAVRLDFPTRYALQTKDPRPTELGEVMKCRRGMLIMSDLRTAPAKLSYQKRPEGEQLAQIRRIMLDPVSHGSEIPSHIHAMSGPRHSYVGLWSQR